MPVLVVVGLDLVVAALLPLILLVATEVLVKILTWIIPSISIPGIGNLKDRAKEAFNTALAAEWRLMDDTLKPLGKMIRTITGGITWVLKGIRDGLFQLYLIVMWLLKDALPAFTRWSINQLRALGTQIDRAASAVKAFAVHYADQIWTRTAGALTALEARVRRYVDAQDSAVIKAFQAELGIVIGWATGQFAALRRYVDAQDQSILAWARNQIAAAVHAVNLRIDQVVSWAQAKFVAADRHAEAVADAAYRGAVATVDSEVRTGAAPGWGALVGAAVGLGAEAGAEFGASVEHAGDIPHGVPANVAAAIGALTTVTTALTILAKDCTVPNCRNLSKYGNELAGLMGALEAGLIWEFAAAAAADPEGTASAVRHIVGPVARGGADIVQGLIRAAA